MSSQYPRGERGGAEQGLGLYVSVTTTLPLFGRRRARRLAVRRRRARLRDRGLLGLLLEHHALGPRRAADAIHQSVQIADHLLRLLQ